MERNEIIRLLNLINKTAQLVDNNSSYNNPKNIYQKDEWLVFINAKEFENTGSTKMIELYLKEEAITEESFNRVIANLLIEYLNS